MLPNPNATPVVDDETEKKPTIMGSKTWKIGKNRIVEMIDGIEAMEQAVWKRLATERYVYEIYDDKYGMQTVDLIGKDFVFVAAELESRITETLLNDDRISAVDQFEFKQGKDYLWVGFRVTTIFGELAGNFKMGKEGRQDDW